MINTDRVLSTAYQLYGVGKEGNNHRVLCSLVCSEIQPLIRDNADENDIRILILCAAKLNFRLCSSASEEDEVTSFEAGDVSVSLNPYASTEKAEKELQRATLAASPLLRDDSFLFRQVKM